MDNAQVAAVVEYCDAEWQRFARARRSGAHSMLLDISRRLQAFLIQQTPHLADAITRQIESRQCNWELDGPVDPDDDWYQAMMEINYSAKVEPVVKVLGGYYVTWCRAVEGTSVWIVTLLSASGMRASRVIRPMRPGLERIPEINRIKQALELPHALSTVLAGSDCQRWLVSREFGSDGIDVNTRHTAKQPYLWPVDRAFCVERVGDPLFWDELTKAVLWRLVLGCGLERLESLAWVERGMVSLEREYIEAPKTSMAAIVPDSVVVEHARKNGQSCMRLLRRWSDVLAKMDSDLSSKIKNRCDELISAGDEWVTLQV